MLVNRPSYSFPERYRLPGEKIPGRLHIAKLKGVVTRCIAFELSYYGIPRDVDRLIDQIPNEAMLDGLRPMKKQYMSFALYSLSHMLAAGTLSPEFAWTIYNGELRNLIKDDKDITSKKYQGMRIAFLKQVVKEVKGEIGKDDFASLQSQYFSTETRGLDLLKFEFWARAGKTGLDQYKRYGRFAQNLIFDDKTCKDMREVVKEEYRKALWLEMRLVEDMVGLKGLNEDVGKFILGDGAFYHYDKDAIEARVAATPRRGREGVGSTIRSEIKHWLTAFIAIPTPWVEEMMDRMHMAGFTERVEAAFKGKKNKLLSPEQWTFKYGGYYLVARNMRLNDPEASYPVYPAEFPRARIGSDEPHEVAEYMERKIRKRVILAHETGQIPANQIREVYRKTGIYVAILDLEGKTKKQILAKIRALDLKEIDEYFKLNPEKMIPIYEKLLSSRDHVIRGFAAEAIIRFKGLIEGSDEYMKYHAYNLIGRDKWKDLRGIGGEANAALRSALSDDLLEVREKAARALAYTGDGNTLHALKKALKTASPTFRKIVRLAIHKIEERVKQQNIS